MYRIIFSNDKDRFVQPLRISFFLAYPLWVYLSRSIFALPVDPGRFAVKLHYTDTLIPRK